MSLERSGSNLNSWPVLSISPHWGEGGGGWIDEKQLNQTHTSSFLSEVCLAILGIFGGEKVNSMFSGCGHSFSDRVCLYIRAQDLDPASPSSCGLFKKKPRLCRLFFVWSLRGVQRELAITFSDYLDDILGVQWVFMNCRLQPNEMNQALWGLYRRLLLKVNLSQWNFHCMWQTKLNYTGTIKGLPNKNCQLVEFKSLHPSSSPSSHFLSLSSTISSFPCVPHSVLLLFSPLFISLSAQHVMIGSCSLHKLN